MSNVRVCDRCGRQIGKDGMEIDIRAYKYHRFLLNTEREYSHGCDDLCAICMKDYFAFMDGAEVVRKEDAVEAPANKVTYLCDCTQCDYCTYPLCKRTTDIRHAKNFKEVCSGKYAEGDDNYKTFHDKVIGMLSLFCDDDDQISIKRCELEVNMKSILEEFV